MGIRFDAKLVDKLTSGEKDLLRHMFEVMQDGLEDDSELALLLPTLETLHNKLRDLYL